jgi:hypothetical protein
MAKRQSRGDRQFFAGHRSVIENTGLNRLVKRAMLDAGGIDQITRSNHARYRVVRWASRKFCQSLDKL